MPPQVCAIFPLHGKLHPDSSANLAPPFTIALPHQHLPHHVSPLLHSCPPDRNDSLLRVLQPRPILPRRLTKRHTLLHRHADRIDLIGLVQRAGTTSRRLAVAPRARIPIHVRQDARCRGRRTRLDARRKRGGGEFGTHGAAGGLADADADVAAELVCKLEGGDLVGGAAGVGDAACDAPHPLLGLADAFGVAVAVCGEGGGAGSLGWGQLGAGMVKGGGGSLRRRRGRCRRGWSGQRRR